MIVYDARALTELLCWVAYHYPAEKINKVMGLETVEIVISTEETFGIDVTDEDAARIFTPKELVDYLSSRISTVSVETCLTQQLFYRLRRGFKQQIAALAQTFDLDTSLKDILHKDQWPTVWAAVRADVGSDDWPEIVPWPAFLKEGPKTVRQLIWHVVEHLPRPSIERGEAWTRPGIEAQVRRIIREITGKQDFSLRAHFIKDLGLN